MTVLYEDNHIIIVNKESGEIVQGDKTGDTPLSDIVKAYIKERYHKPGNVFLGVVHRLDRPVQGLVLFAKTSKALTRLNDMFREKNEDLKKIYWAIVPSSRVQWSMVNGQLDKDSSNLPPPQGGAGGGLPLPLGEGSGERYLRHWLVRNEQKNKSFATPYVEGRPAPRGAKLATLRYRAIAHSQRYTLLEIQLLSGRHHQIRCQLAAIGCPIKGDLKYGAPRSNPDGSISLLARRLEFTHPVSKEHIVVEAPLPPQFQIFG
ncbi:MAG: RNA pseudouridine synthase [Prevotella sp.]|nr:RNA pseudouridine synthase [Prevotella sp.]